MKEIHINQGQLSPRQCISELSPEIILLWPLVLQLV
ncbi:hypothetical protein Xmau_03297 [Xenorhabdus mauleonii]|uniref:Uncharacterized protein n=1 Tax=Xenorhabdus mauleonii TaxID=351675 RepID=A0A1I3W593_9GAMM|nr:hypothetical protein Xmau_03297 [Xenorhabdus mauleonii]SFK02814.1 hypothetical protein SAMN05421680_12454 [Xenorhabdus mauleonii]